MNNISQDEGWMKYLNGCENVKIKKDVLRLIGLVERMNERNNYSFL